MIFKYNRGLKYLEFELFNEYKVKHAIFSRHGGVSPKPWESLNIGSTVGDSKSNVEINIRKIFDAFGRDIDTLFDVWQVHGLDAAVATKPRPIKHPHKKADILITQNKDVTLLARFADCVPILLYDTNKKIIAIVHAGWRGSVNKIAAKAIEQMENKFHCNPGDIIAGIGPSIGPEKYEVGGDVIAAVKNINNLDYTKYLDSKGGKTLLNLWDLNQDILLEAGVKFVEMANICTATDVNDWFSHRKESGNTGRFGVVISL